MSDAGFAVQMLDVSHDPDAGLPVVEEIVGILNPPPPPPCRWGCGETMRPVTKHGAFVCRKCDAWQFLALWNGDWVEAEDIPHLRARASINPLVAYRSALQKIADADLKRTSAGWLQQIAVEALQRHEKASGPQGYPEPRGTP